MSFLVLKSARKNSVVSVGEGFLHAFHKTFV